MQLTGVLSCHNMGPSQSWKCQVLGKHSTKSCTLCQKWLSLHQQCHWNLVWKDLADRRWDLRLALLFKIIHGHTAMPTENILVTADSRTRAKHQYKCRCISASTTEYKNTFLSRTIKEWNNCPADLIGYSSRNSFKDMLTQRSRHACSVWSSSTHWCDTPMEICQLSRQDKTRQGCGWLNSDCSLCFRVSDFSKFWVLTTDSFTSW